MTRRAPGFSLIEMAFVLIIVTLLLGGLLVPFATQVEQKRIAETNKAMEEIKEALLGFALAHKRLPCPDTIASNDGVEDPQGGPCPVNTVGNLPWATLGVGTADAWGNRFTYQVTPEFSDPATFFSLGTPGTLRICSSYTCASPVANTVPAVIVSHGKNGYGAVNSNTPIGPPAANAAPTGKDEQQNLHNTIPPSTDFVSRIQTGPRSACADATAAPCEFDDLVVWISPNVLFNRMVAAGQLPN